MHLYVFQENMCIFALAKAAKEHKEQAVKQTAKEWKRMGIKGKVVLV